MSPSRFREELKRFDKRLDFVWNGRKSCWEVIGIDMRGQTYIIHSVPLGKLDTLGKHIISAIYDASPTKQGGAEAMNRRIDDLISQEEEQQDRQLRDIIDNTSSEAHDMFMRRSKLRISNAGIPETITVTDRRRICQQDI